jgi:hypothetical protein
MPDTVVDAQELLRHGQEGIGAGVGLLVGADPRVGGLDGLVVPDQDLALLTDRGQDHPHGPQGLVEAGDHGSGPIDQGSLRRRLFLGLPVEILLQHGGHHSFFTGQL